MTTSTISSKSNKHNKSKSYSIISLKNNKTDFGKEKNYNNDINININHTNKNKIGNECKDFNDYELNSFQYGKSFNI